MSCLSPISSRAHQSLGDHFVERVAQLLQAVRLGEKFRGAALFRAIGVGAGLGGGQHDGGKVRRLARREIAQQREAVLARHLQIDDRHVRSGGPAVEQLDRLDAVARDPDLGDPRNFGERAPDQVDVGVVVLDQQHAQAARQAPCFRLGLARRRKGRRRPVDGKLCGRNSYTHGHRLSFYELDPVMNSWPIVMSERFMSVDLSGNPRWRG